MDLLLICSEGKDSPPDGHGQRLTKKLGEYMEAGYPIEVIYSSPDVAAGEIATYIAQPRQLTVFKSQAIRNFDPGLTEGLTNNITPYPSPDFSHLIHRHPRGGESVLEVYHRLAEFSGMLQEYHCSQSVALVSHQDIISLLMQHLLGLPIGAPIAFATDYGAVSHMYIGPKYTRLLCFNYTCP